MKIIDLNRIEDLMLEGYSLNTALSEATNIDYIGSLEKGSHVYFQIYSLDVQYGISINELNIFISVTDVTDDIASAIPYFYDFYLPDVDKSFTAYCPIYCGLGHSNMKLKFEIGEGKPHYGKTILNVFVILIATAASIFSYLISSPIKRKIFLFQKTPNSTKTASFDLKTFYLYDISKLSAKELIALRQGYLEVEKAGYLLEKFVDRTLEDVKTQVLSGDNARDYELIEFS